MEGGLVCEDLNLAGLSDWRLPNRNEMLSLVNYNGNIPAIDPIFSTTTKWTSGASYWISTTGLTSNSFAVRVDFGTGYVHDSIKSVGNYVRAVRGGQCGEETTSANITPIFFLLLESQ